MTSDDDQPATHAAPNQNVPAAGAKQPAEPPQAGEQPSEEARSEAAAGSPEPEGGGASAASAPQSRIRIGSQRWREKNPAAKPRPAGEFLPSRRAPGAERSAEFEQAATEAASDAPPSLQPAAGQAADAAIAQGETVSAASPASATAGPAPAAESQPRTDRKPDEEKPGRGRRDRRPKNDKVPLVEPVRERKVAPPNIRAELTPDLEQELANALGDMSVAEMLAPDATGEVGNELEPESRHRARIIMVHRDDVFVDLGGRRQGILPGRSLVEPPEPGNFVDVVVNRFNAAEGLYEVGVPGSSVRVEDWSQVSEGLVVDARVTGHNKGGLECEVNGLRGFIPAGQVSLYRVEDLSQFVGQKFACVITEANPDKRNLVLSRRGVLEREKADAKANLLAELEVGQVREGIVRSLQEFGAFVDLGGVDGLVHVSQLSWDRIRHANEVLEVGQKIKVKIQKIDPETGKISLAFRDLAENPWTGAAQKFPPRSRATGTISRITEFGAFVRLDSGIEGLVHISELSHRRVWRATDIVQEGQEVEVLILSVDAERQRIGLSLKALESRPQAPAKDQEETTEPEPVAVPSSKRKLPLKGGIGKSSGGEKFGLNW